MVVELFSLSYNKSNFPYCGVKPMQPEIDYERIGQRIRKARLEKRLSQADLGALVGCSNNHMSHLEVGQTKVSLQMLLKLAYVLEKDFDYFLMDTPYARKDPLINGEIVQKLRQCSSATLVSINQIIDILLQQQRLLQPEQEAF